MTGTGFTIPLSKVIEEFELEKVYVPDDIDDIVVQTSDLNRPGMQLAGYFDYFDVCRIQILGKVEHTYLDNYPMEKRSEILDQFFGLEFPAIIVTRGMQIHPEMLQTAENHKNLFSEQKKLLHPL